MTSWRFFDSVSHFNTQNGQGDFAGFYGAGARFFYVGKYCPLGDLSEKNKTGRYKNPAFRNDGLYLLC